MEQVEGECRLSSHSSENTSKLYGLVFENTFACSGAALVVVETTCCCCATVCSGFFFGGGGGGIGNLLALLTGFGTSVEE